MSQREDDKKTLDACFGVRCPLRMECQMFHNLNIRAKCDNVHRFLGLVTSSGKTVCKHFDPIPNAYPQN